MPATWTGLVTSVSTVLSFRRARARRRISALIHDSRRLYAEKQHEESLAKAVKAKDTAAELGTATRDGIGMLSFMLRLHWPLCGAMRRRLHC